MSAANKNRFAWIALLVCAIALFMFGRMSNPPAAHAQGGLGSKVYISTATTTTVLPGAGFFDRININGGTAGAVTLYDIAAAGCTGTPASGKFATIASTSVPVTLHEGFRMTNGLCAVTAAATDVTIIVN